MDSEIEELPTDYVRGLDFKIAKTSKGGYADYTTSNWSRRERALSEAENEAIAKHGLFDLKTFLPKKPTDVELKVMKEMFEASVDGEAFDMDRWGQYFKPDGMKGNNFQSSNATPVATTQAAPKVSAPADEDDNDDTTTTTPATTVEQSALAGEAGSRAADIIAMIRKRQQS